MLQRITALLIVLLFSPLFLLAQEKGKLVGKIEDATSSEELIGVAVGIKGSSFGTSTDIEGKYTLSLLPGTYTIVISYMGYKSEEITEVEIKAGQVTNLNAAMKENVTELEEVVITYKAEKASTDALMLERKNSVTVSDGISAELIKKTPDRNTSDVLKRVTGASIQDNKFAIIRGLNDRYNAAFLNGAPLPSTEPDRKAFSFDIFPANLLDNLTITKTATPDQTGDFGGGIITLVTKDIPDLAFVEVSAGGTNNSITTSQKFYQTPKGSQEWLGLDNGYRQIPEGVPGNEANVWKGNTAPDRVEKSRIGNLFSNNWAGGVRETKLFGDKVSPGYNFQLSGGTPIGKRFGFVAALTYRRSFAFSQQERNTFNSETSLDAPAEKTQENLFDLYKDNVNAGAMLNMAYKVNEFHRFSFKNTANVLSEDLFMMGKTRTIVGTDENREKGTLSIFTSSTLISNQLMGEHFLPQSKLKFEWVAGHSSVNRDIPDFKRLKYREQGQGTDIYQVNLTGDQVNEESGSRLYTKSSENIKSFSYSIKRDFHLLGFKHNIKVGAYHQYRDRKVNSNMYGMTYRNNAANKPTDSILQLPDNQVFGAANIKSPGGFYVNNYTSTYKWNYGADAMLNAAYFMLDHQFNALRVIWGVRFESYATHLAGFEGQGVPLNRDTVVVDRLPSLNLVYSLNPRSNLRLSYAQTINRPEFREFSTFSFYDPINQLSLRGNPDLKRAYIYNFDARYEFFPGAGQVISFTGFYKRFENSIEFVYKRDADEITYANTLSAYNFGVELEFRQTLQSIVKMSQYKFLEYTTLFANLSLIGSRVDLSSQPDVVNKERPLQGQSPYIVNCGALFNNPNKDYSINLSFNKVGRRIFLVGSSDESVLDIYERPRDVLDLQFAKSFRLKFTQKSLVEIKLNVNDLLAQDFVFYQDIDRNGKFNEDKDYVFNRLSVGRNVSLNVGLKF